MVAKKPAIAVHHGKRCWEEKKQRALYPIVPAADGNKVKTITTSLFQLHPLLLLTPALNFLNKLDDGKPLSAIKSYVVNSWVLPCQMQMVVGCA